MIFDEHVGLCGPERLRERRGSSTRRRPSPYLIAALVVLLFGPGVLSVDGLIKRCSFRRQRADGPGGRPMTLIPRRVGGGPAYRPKGRSMNEPTLNRRDLNRLALAALGGLASGLLAGCGPGADTGKDKAAADKDKPTRTKTRRPRRRDAAAAARPARLPRHQHLQEQGQAGHDQRLRRPGALRHGQGATPARARTTARATAAAASTPARTTARARAAVRCRWTRARR